MTQEDSAEFPAQYLVFWPGEATYMCERHLQAAKRVAEAMGFQLDYREGDGGCENCAIEWFSKHREGWN